MMRRDRTRDALQTSQLDRGYGDETHESTNAPKMIRTRCAPGSTMSPRSRRSRPDSLGAEMDESLPIVLVPGLLCTPRLYSEQLPALWRFGPVTVADHTRDASIAGIARRILSLAPPRFALI